MTKWLKLVRIVKGKSYNGLAFDGAAMQSATTTEKKRVQLEQLSRGKPLRCFAHFTRVSGSRLGRFDTNVAGGNEFRKMHFERL